MGNGKKNDSGAGKVVKLMCNQKRLQTQNAIKNVCKLKMQSKTVAKSLVWI